MRPPCSVNPPPKPMRHGSIPLRSRRCPRLSPAPGPPTSGALRPIQHSAGCPTGTGVPATTAAPGWGRLSGRSCVRRCGGKRGDGPAPSPCRTAQLPASSPPRPTSGKCPAWGGCVPWRGTRPNQSSSPAGPQEQGPPALAGFVPRGLWPDGDHRRGFRLLVAYAPRKLDG